MTSRLATLTSRWTAILPVAALVVFALAWHRDLPWVAVAVVSVFLGGAVLAAVHHAEIIAHRVGEPYGSLVLAVAVTVIEVALIVTLVTTGAKGSESLARDTVFAAIMITCNGIVGVSLLAATRKGQVAHFNAEGTGARTRRRWARSRRCASCSRRSRRAGRDRSSRPASSASRPWHRWACTPCSSRCRPSGTATTSCRPGATARSCLRTSTPSPPSARAAWISVGFLLVALAAVVGNAKNVSPSLEDARRRGRHAAGRRGRHHRPADPAARDDRRRARGPAQAGADQPQPGVRIGDGQHRPDDPGHRDRPDLARRPVGARAGLDRAGAARR